MQTTTGGFESTQHAAHAKYSRIDELSDEIGELSGYLNAANCRFLELVAEFDELEGWGHQGAKTCAHWLNWKCGIGLNAAREKVRTARAMLELPQIHGAFKAGRISYSKVRAMTRVATPDNEDYLLMIAIHGTATHVEKLVRGYRWTIARDEERSKEKKQHDERYCRHFWDSDGCLVIQARMTAEQGAMFVKALEAARVQVFDEADRCHDPEPGVTVTSDERQQDRTDALSRLAETFLAHGPGTLSGGERHQVMLIANRGVLNGTDLHGQCRIDEGPVIASDTMRRLCCDASVRHVRSDEAGEPLSIGRRSRTIPTPMRKALLLRDQGCRFPGCANTRYVDGHHIVHWSNGGETSLHNLVALCRHHHRLVHECGFTVERIGPNRFEFKSPSGNVIADASPPPQPTRRPDLGVHIDKDTAACQWDGLPGDYGGAIEALQRRDGRWKH